MDRQAEWPAGWPPPDQVPTLKYRNHDAWLGPVTLYQPALAQAIRDIHHAICLADDVADRAVRPGRVGEALWYMVRGVKDVAPRDGGDRLVAVLEEIYKGELANLEFYPGSEPIEREWEIWLQRSALMNLYFTGWCLADPSFDTPAHWDWFVKLRRWVLAYDDIMDCVSLTFEDLRLCRRNYVILEHFGCDGYYGWMGRQEEIVTVARSVTLAIEPPPDPRMQVFCEGADHG